MTLGEKRFVLVQSLQVCIELASRRSGETSRLRFDVAEHRVLRTLAKDHFHFYKPSLLALEAIHAFAFHYFVPYLCSPFLDCFDWRIPRSSTSTGVGGEVDVLDYCIGLLMNHDFRL